MSTGLDLTNGSISKKLLFFSAPLMIGNILQQLYNIVDTVIVGKYLGQNALAAVGSAYTIMIFITSIISGLCMGSSVFFSIQYGKKAYNTIKQSFFISFVSILLVTAVLNLLAYTLMNKLIIFMQIPIEIQSLFRQYLLVIFSGIIATFLYNIFSNLLRAVGNSIAPLLFLALSTVVNIILDLLFIIKFDLGVIGAGTATVISQYISGLGLIMYYYIKCTNLRVNRRHMKWNKSIFCELFSLSAMTCIQQSIMNFGILMVQGLVNSFGTAVMAAFAAGVKIDTVAYSPVQDFGNAFSSFIAQNYGAEKKDRIHKGIKTAITMVIVFCIIISSLVYLLAPQLMMAFVDKESIDVIEIGVKYLRIEGTFYIGIGILFLLYGYYRAIKKPAMSVVLTIISLGTRVALAYALSTFASIGVIGIWLSIPIGWFLADLIGIIYYQLIKRSCDF
ncbi:MAG: MATE family efflux transporter [Eubacterium sp.]|nr:MATE family efflux transporter [Eubacterium sp.]